MATKTSDVMKSTHKVEVVPIVLQPHPNSDGTLSIVEVYGYSSLIYIKI
jgi:hypothetical protein